MIYIVSTTRFYRVTYFPVVLVYKQLLYFIADSFDNSDTVLIFRIFTCYLICSVCQMLCRYIYGDNLGSVHRTVVHVMFNFIIFKSMTVLLE